MTTKLNSRNIDDIQVFFVKQCYGYPRGDLVNGFAINEFMANGGCSRHHLAMLGRRTISSYRPITLPSLLPTSWVMC